PAEVFDGGHGEALVLQEVGDYVTDDGRVRVAGLQRRGLGLGPIVVEHADDVPDGGEHVVAEDGRVRGHLPWEHDPGLGAGRARAGVVAAAHSTASASRATTLPTTNI